MAVRRRGSGSAFRRKRGFKAVDGLQVRVLPAEGNVAFEVPALHDGNVAWWLTIRERERERDSLIL